MITKPHADLGCAVVSKRGRDAGRTMLVVGIVDADYVLVADGDLRRIANPKKKKLKHLVFKNVVCDDVAQALVGDQPLTDACIRRALCGVLGCKDGQKE